MQKQPEGAGQPEITITIDGLEYTVTERRQSAAALLELAGVQASDHDLARVVGRGDIEKRFADDDIIQITPGAKYVSVFTGATPVA